MWEQAVTNQRARVLDAMDGSMGADVRGSRETEQREDREGRQRGKTEGTEGTEGIWKGISVRRVHESWTRYRRNRGEDWKGTGGPRGTGGTRFQRVALVLVLVLVLVVLGLGHYTTGVCVQSSMRPRRPRQVWASLAELWRGLQFERVYGMVR